MALFDLGLVNGLRYYYVLAQLLLNVCIDFIQSLQMGVYHCGLILEVIGNILMELWPSFVLGFVNGLRY